LIPAPTPSSPSNLTFISPFKEDGGNVPIVLAHECENNSFLGNTTEVPGYLPINKINKNNSNM
jgi:hypothetical protein